MYVDSGALVKCTKLTTNLSDNSSVFLNGTVTGCRSFGKKCLNFRVASGNLHVGINGVLGQNTCYETSDERNKKKNRKMERQNNPETDGSNEQDPKPESGMMIDGQSKTKKLYLEIVNGNLTNFGTICVQEYLLLICNVLMLCEDSKNDTASRGFRSYTALQRESAKLPSAAAQESPKKTSSFYDQRLISTVRRLNAKDFVTVLNEEVDPTFKVDNRNVYSEFNNICQQANGASHDKDKDEKEVIRGSLSTWKWKHGKIWSSSIKCIANCINDCSQLRGEYLDLHVEKDAKVVKPWTWICGQVSGIVKGDFLFHDNAVFTKSNELYVVGNLRILETSAVCFKEGGKLIIGEELDNNSTIISDKSFILDVGYMKQGRNCSVVSSQDLLLSLRKEFSDIWFGYIYANVHLFIQVQERVACDANCVSKEVDVEFFGESPQFVMTGDLVAEEGSLSLKSETKCESANFVLTGRLSAHGIDGETASVFVLPGGKIALTPTRANMNEVGIYMDEVGINMNEVDVITRWLKVSNQAVVEIAQKHNEESTLCKNSKLSTNIYCKESLMVDGTLIAFGSYLTSYSETLSNSGLIKLFTSDPSSSLLEIDCDEEVSNSGIIESAGNMIIEANVVSNKRGVIKSSPFLRIVMYDIGATSLGGKIIIDKSLFIHSHTQEELSLSMVGGKRDNDEHFVSSGQLEVKCNKGHLKLNSSIVCTDEQQEQVEESNMVLNLHKCLTVLSDCELHDARVIFAQTEDNNNTEENSKFVIQDSLKVKSLRLRSDNVQDPNISEKEKEKVSFEGFNKTTTIDTLVVDQSIKEVEFATKNRFVCTNAVLCCEVATIKTDLECVVVAANNLSVLGRMGLKGEKSEEIESLVDVEYTSIVHGTVECFGHVKMSIGESFVQAENGSLVVEEELQIEVANENSHGMVSLEGSTKGQAESVVKIGGGNIKVTGSFSEVQNLTLDASMNMTLSEKSTISCEEINMEGEWITTAGVIKGFHTLIIKPWAVMNSGCIDSENEASNISFTSDLALINSGICRAQTTYLEAPFLLSLPGEPVSDVNDITRCALLGRENLKLESIACFLGGSSILSCKRYENISVLLFKFLTYVACTPDSKSLEAWSKAAESLKSIQSQATTDAEKQDSTKLRTLMKDMRKGTEVDLRIAQMYNMVNDFVAEILKNGIKSFDTGKLVHILTIESERYTKVNILIEKLLQIPEKAKFLRRLAKKGIKKVQQSIRKKLGFSDPKMQSQQKEGIFESGFYSFGEGVTVTDSVYEAAFVEVYSDQGFMMAVDFLASAKDVILSKREKKAVALAIYAETLRMENIDAEQVIAKADEAKLNKVKSNVLDVEATQSIDAKDIKGNKVVMESKDLKVSTLDAKNTNLIATNSARLKNIDSDNLNVNSGQSVDAEDIKGNKVVMESKDLKVTTLDAKSTSLSAANSARLKNIDSDNLNVNSGQSIDAENIKGDRISMESKDLKISTLDAKNTNLSATNSARLKNIDSDDLNVNSDRSIDAENIKGNKVVMESKDLKVTTLDAKNTNLSATNSARLKNIDSNDLNVNSDRSIDAENIKGNKVVMESKDLKVTTLDAKNTNLSATNSARLKNIDSNDLNVNSDRSIDAESIKGDRVSMESKDLSVSNLDAKTTKLRSSNNSNVRNVKSRNLTVIGGGSVDAQNIRGSNIQIQGKEEVLVKNVSGKTVGAKSLASSVRATNINSSEETVIVGEKDVDVGGINSKTAVIKASRGQVNASGKIEADKAFIESKKGINLAYNKNGKKTADHRFSSLQMKTNKINQVNDLLKGDGIYKNLKICDELGLVVSDQDVILSSCVVQQDYKLNLEARSVNVDNAYLNWKKGASITSSTSMNVNNAFISAQESISLKSKIGNVNMNSSGVQAGKIAKIEASNGSVSLTGSSISGDEAAIVKAKQNVIINPIVESHSTSSRRRGFFSSSGKSCSYSTVTKSRITSSKGNVTVVAEEGKVQAIATEFNAAKDLKIIGTKGVDIRDLITIREEVSVKKNWFRTKKSVRRYDEHHKSSVNGGRQYIKGKNINMIGTSCNTKGDMIFDADETVSIQERILSSSEQTHSSGISFSAKKGLSIGSSIRQQNQQTLAGSKLQAGGNLVMKGKNVSVTNAMEMDVGNLVVDAENVMFKGAELNSSYSESGASLSIGPKSIEFTAEQGFGRQKNIQNQNINVRGETKFLNCKKATLDASNLNTGPISGNVEEFDVISRVTEVEAYKQSTSIGFTVCKGFPVPSKFGMSQSSDQGKFVKKSSGIHVRDYIKSNEFRVGNLFLKGSAVTANGDVAKFAQNIIKEKVKSYRSQTASGFNLGIDKRGIEFGIYQSEKYMEMEHNATIGSFSGTVSHEIQQSVNTDLSKHCQITKSQSSNVGLNVSVGKEGCAASVQVDDVGVDFSARKDEIGIQAQSGDKGFGFSAGSSGASLSLQNGENSLGVGLTNQGMSFNARSADTAIGASVGKNGASATVISKDFSISGSSINGSTSVQTNVGDFKGGISRNKDSETGERSTSTQISHGEFGISATSSTQSQSFSMNAGELGIGFEKSKATSEQPVYSGNIKAGEFEIQGSSSKNQKSIGLKVADFQTQMNVQNDTETGKSTYDANLKAGDFGIEASSSQNNKSIGIETGAFKTNIKQGKDSKTGKSTYDANLKAGDLGIEASSSQNNKSIGIEAGDFKTNIKRGKDSKSGKSTYDANVKAGDFGIEASSSQNNKSIGIEAGDFKTNIKRGKDSKSGKSTYDANVKAGDFGIEASSSQNNKSIGIEAGDFKTNIKQGKDSKTGKSTYDANLKAGDLGIEASSSQNNKSIGIEAGDFKTNIKQGKDCKTGKSTYDANVKAGDFGIEASSSQNNKSIGIEAGDFKTNIKRGKDSKSGKSTYDASLKAGDFGIEASSSQNNKSIGIDAGDFKTNIKQGKDSKTGKSTYDANLKAGDFGIEASSSQNNKSIGIEAGDFKTNIKQGKDSKTGKSTYDANLKAGDFGIEASSSQNNKSIGIEAGDFKTNIKRGKDSKSGKSTYDANVKAGDFGIEASSSQNNKSIGIEAGDFKTNIKQGKDSKTGKSTYDANLKAGDFGIEASSSQNNKSIGIEAGDFKTNIKQGKDSKTGKSTYDANLKAGDFGIEASSSQNNKSIGIEAGDFKTNIKRGKDSKSGKSTYDANVKAGDFGIEASSSQNNKSIGIEAGDFKTNIKQGKDSKTGKSTYDANLKAGDFGIEASSSQNNKSIGIEAGDFKTNIKRGKDSKSGKSTYDANVKAGDFGIEASSSQNNKSIGIEAGDFKTNIKQGKDSKTGKSTYDANLKAGDFGIEASSSQNNKSIGIEAGDFKTNIKRGKDSKSGKSTYDANVKAGDFGIEASSSQNNKSIGIEAGDFKTNIKQGKDSKTGKSTYDANLKAGDFGIEASSSQNNKSIGIEAGDFKTNIKQGKDSKTGKSTYDANLKAGDFGIEASSSQNNKSIGIEAGDFKTNIKRGKDSKSGKSTYDANVKSWRFWNRSVIFAKQQIHWNRSRRF